MAITAHRAAGCGPLVFLAALGLYAFRISLGSQPIFGTATLED